MPYIGAKELKASDIRRFDVTSSTSATHTLTWTPPTEQSLIVTINGIKQHEDAYSVSGTTLTLSSPLVATDKLEVIGINDIGTTITPAQNSVDTDKIVNNAVTSAKLDTNIAIDGDLTVDTNTLHVDSTNNRVGIGTASAAKTLDVAGTSRITGEATFGNDVLLTNDAYVYSSSGGSGVRAGWFLDGNNQQVRGYTAGSERMRIDSSGNLLVGQTLSGASRVEIKGVNNTSSNYSLLCRNSDSTLSFYVRNDGIINVGQDGNSPYNYSVSGRDLYVDSAGTMGYLSSTRESKDNIEPLGDISWLYDLNAVSFNYRTKDDETNAYTEEVIQETEYGLIAEEVEQVNADLCFYDQDEEGTQTLAGVTYRKLIPVLIKAIQEQQAIIEDLQTRLSALEAN